MSSMAVEAKSLSSLTALASNPPAYPRNPTHVKHEPLVLYIARVPGSKDVFLSPMKPREKVVTAEDITSSLYFVHVEHPQDVNLINYPEAQDPDYPEQRPNPGNRLSAPAIQRKAVPSTPTGAPARKPVPGTLAPIANFDSRQNTSAGQYAQRPGMLSPGYEPRGSYDSTRSQTENDIPTIQPRRPEVNVTPTGISLTLIRRDPASGAQWNVARIDDPTIAEITSTELTLAAARRKPGAPMYIEISNPGYSKFLHSETDQKPPLPTRTSDLSVRSYQSSNAPLRTGVDYPPELSSKNDNVFRRRLWMEGSHLGGGFGHRKSGSYDRNSSRPTSRGNYDDRPSMDRPISSPSFLTRDDQAYGTLQVSERQSSFRGYVFTSPWNGRCEFITGASGGTLKCRHVIPGLQGAPPAAATVSEMKFNLPSVNKAPSPREETSKRSSLFKRGRHSRNNSVSVNRNEGVEDARSSLDRMDLSLGQEFAGGGFGGKQAKLGKIILEDEGLKMMDLLVATNIGLWWRAYEKAQAAARGDRSGF
ncbi:hypothetical protein BU25DRAFT_193227 [Macroventuria anomochaeta]|uniref:Uncharacterized protein n=1 Tax=Macroventuria anomochaeta TaxID=301207 RepID=A0ACB6SBH5_9PLEO|nr:uncharacterized protein BU25DRAFT_193227 [Macroventuria anomochaeta]KAF2631656.1 hypothetical protein BU25DRAFT_193227 [Macroventuria anomochaeta]